MSERESEGTAEGQTVPERNRSADSSTVDEIRKPPEATVSRSLTPDREQLRQLAEEGIEWVKDFRNGDFHVTCGCCQVPLHIRSYMPPELDGLLSAHQDLARGVLDLLELGEEAARLLQDELLSQKGDEAQMSQFEWNDRALKWIEEWRG